MALHMDFIGKKSDPVPFTYDEDKLILYALGVGAQMDELDFIYEKNLKALPTFCVNPFYPILLNHFMPDININMFALLHGEHKIILHKPIPTSGTLYTTSHWDSVFDKGDKGAMVNVTFETVDEKGTLLFENKVLLIDRSAGNFGGDRGPKTTPVIPPAGKEPDFSAAYEVPMNQTAIFSLSGDKNPLHLDPEVAKKGGLDRPILQGLCTYGYAGRAVLHNACGSDPERLKSFSVRFVNMAYPGDTLITKGWKIEDGKGFIIETTNQDGKIILGKALAETI